MLLLLFILKSSTTIGVLSEYYVYYHELFCECNIYMSRTGGYTWFSSFSPQSSKYPIFGYPSSPPVGEGAFSGLLEKPGFACNTRPFACSKNPPGIVFIISIQGVFRGFLGGFGGVLGVGGIYRDYVTSLAG